MDILKPKIRAVEIFPTLIDGKEMIILKDPLNICSQMVFLTPESFFLVALMDGSRTIYDLSMEFFKKKGVLPSSHEIFILVKQLSELGLLEDENFSNFLKLKAENFLKNGIRPSICAGNSYPSSAEDLIEFLKEIEKIEVLKREIQPDFLISPHLDINLSKITYAHSYKNLKLNNKKTIIIFGVAHYGLSRPISVLPIPFETPLGIVKIDEELAKNFIENFGKPDEFEIISHSMEHSIELQLIFLQYFLKKEFLILPVLVDFSKGSFEYYKPFFIDLIGKKEIFFIAGIDLSHIGPRYGDQFPAEEETMEKIKDEEKYLIDLVIKKDRENFEKFEKEKGSALKICGIGILKMLLDFQIKSGTIRYHQTGFMPPIASAVNCVSMDLFF